MVKFCPMHAILLLGFQMRSNLLHTVLAPWVQWWRYTITICVLAQTVLEITGKALVAHSTASFLKFVLKILDMAIGSVMDILGIFALEALPGNPNRPDCSQHTPLTNLEVHLDEENRSAAR